MTSLIKSRKDGSATSLQSKLSRNTSLVTVKTSLESQSVETYLKRKEWEPLEVIGEGGFSTVYKVKKLIGDDDTIYAAKVMRLNQTNRLWMRKCLKHEMFISKLLKHSNIVMTYQHFKTTSYAVIIMQYAANGTIKSEMDKRGHPYSQDEASELFQGLICGLHHIHQMNIAHRDLKLDNFFLDHERRPLIGDFGFATIGVKQRTMVVEAVMRHTKCGSEGYMAPEVARITSNNPIEQPYNAKLADVYSMGVCLYEMLYQTLPPNDTTNNLKFSSNINKEWQGLIKSMLNVRPENRPKTREIIEKISNYQNNLLIKSVKNLIKTFL